MHFLLICMRSFCLSLIFFFLNETLYSTRTTKGASSIQRQFFMIKANFANSCATL
ncbi:hypothetical protein GLYMA_04G064750v4 [Glycine max]|nr:hypothetical protein GLYMA_04G064750v4 [Glycine max]KAH1110094.1 hypothetical protein GYH30_009135 [Glycine max]